MNRVFLTSALVCTLLGIYSSLHTVQEGYVGVVYQFGSLHKETLKPGLHFAIPLVDKVYQVQTTIQTDYIRNVPCGTSSGVNIMFDKIEVVNQLLEPYVYETIKNYTVDYDKSLIFDKITSEMAQFCCKTSLQEVYIDKFDQIDEFLNATLQKSLDYSAPGLKIVSVRLTKPIVPAKVQENYEKIVEYQTDIIKAKTQQQKELQHIQTEKEKTLSKMLADQERKLQEIEAEKQFDLAQIEAAKQKEMLRIVADEEKKLAEMNMMMILGQKSIEKETAHKKGMYELLKFEVEADKLKKETDSNIEHYKNMLYAEYMNKLLTPEYVRIEMAKSISPNTKIYFGESLPKYLFVPGWLNNSSSI